MKRKKDKNKPKNLQIKLEGINRSNPDNTQDFADDFYEEADNKTRKSSCSLPLIFISLFIILIILVGGFWYIKNLLSSRLSFFQKPASTVSIVNIADEMKSDALSKNPGDTITIDVTEDDFADFIGLNNQEFPLKNPSLKFEGSAIIITGKTNSKLISIPLKINVVPLVEDGKIIMKLNELSSSGVDTPKYIRDNVQSFINSALENKMDSLQNIKIESLVIENQTMTIVGTKI